MTPARGSVRWRAGAWRLRVSAGSDPKTGRRRDIYRTVRAANDEEGHREAQAGLVELLEEVQHPQLAAWRSRVEASVRDEMMALLVAERERYEATIAALRSRRTERMVALNQGGFDPHGWFVYCLWGDDPATPLYVGRSSNVLARLGAHLVDPAKRGQVLRVSVTRCADHGAMVDLEAELIARYQPPWNILGVVRSA